MKGTELIENKAAIDMIYLCSCAANEIVPDRDRIEAMDLDALYEVAFKHMLAVMVGIALRNAGTSTPRFAQSIIFAQRKTVVLNYELTQVSAAMEKAKIWHMPLKGAILKDLYPAFAMREMADCDILIDAHYAEDVKHVMENMGYQTKIYGKTVHDIYIKRPVIEFEIHKALFSFRHDKRCRDYYMNVKSRVLLEEGTHYQYRFSENDFYVYMIAHAYRHFCEGGIGLRSLIDTYVYLQKNDLDLLYVNAETEKLGITDYERLNRSLALKLFSKDNARVADLTEEEQQMLDYTITSGAYGTIDHRIENRLKKSGEGKLRYFARRIFGPFRGEVDRAQFERRYTTFFKYPILLPFLPFYRLFRALKKSSQRIKAEANALIKAGKT